MITQQWWGEGDADHTLGGEAWWRGRLGAFDHVGMIRAPPGPLIESMIMS